MTEPTEISHANNNGGAYWRFGAMIATAMVVMFCSCI